jgi:hypothetical protein
MQQQQAQQRIASSQAHRRQQQQQPAAQQSPASHSEQVRGGGSHYGKVRYVYAAAVLCIVEAGVCDPIALPVVSAIALEGNAYVPCIGALTLACADVQMTADQMTNVDSSCVLLYVTP